MEKLLPINFASEHQKKRYSNRSAQFQVAMPNHLAEQTSPYLLQHANNPVDWYPWGKEALGKAKQRDQPILLSIGYSACHWCHVMERESFENSEIADLMNRLFVCIKVDREERPDLDKIYQSAHQMLTQRPGGWPLTVALTPTGHAPFFAGTYFPPTPRFNMPGFGELLERIAKHFQDNRAQMINYHAAFEKALDQLNPASPAKRLPDSGNTLTDAVQSLATRFDREFGGFGSAPKFPHPTQLELLLTHYTAGSENDVKESLKMAETTLLNMGRGGLCDQLGGGFFRYSVDRQWKIPHFEKMLYDNAQLLGLYCDAYRITANNEYAEIARGVAKWVMEAMQQPCGGYASTLDADSEGVEGKFYIWSETDLRAILTRQEYDLIENYFALYGEPNFEGFWHFNVNTELNDDLLSENPPLKKRIENTKSKLLEQRGVRIHPAIDDKILTAWNGLMIKGMAKAARALGQMKLAHSAQRSLDFIRSNQWQNNQLLATHREGISHLNAYLDDYAFLLDGILELLQTEWRSSNLRFAIQIADAMVEKFEDKENGGFFFTSHDHESLLYRPKSGADDAVPAGNGVAVAALITLGYLTGESAYLDSADSALKIFAEELKKMPSIYGALTLGLQKQNRDHKTVIIRGNQTNKAKWKTLPSLQSGARNTIFYIPNNIKDLPSSISDKKPQSDVTAYICTGLSCAPPVFSLEMLMQKLQ